MSSANGHARQRHLRDVRRGDSTRDGPERHRVASPPAFPVTRPRLPPSEAPGGGRPITLALSPMPSSDRRHDGSGDGHQRLPANRNRRTVVSTSNAWVLVAMRLDPGPTRLAVHGDRDVLVRSHDTGDLQCIPMHGRREQAECTHEKSAYADVPGPPSAKSTAAARERGPRMPPPPALVSRARPARPGCFWLTGTGSPRSGATERRRGSGGRVTSCWTVTSPSSDSTGRGRCRCPRRA